MRCVSGENHVQWLPVVFVGNTIMEGDCLRVGLGCGGAWQLRKTLIDCFGSTCKTVCCLSDGE